MLVDMQIFFFTVPIGFLVLVGLGYVCRFGVLTGACWGVALGAAAGLVVPLEMNVLGLRGPLWVSCFSLVTILGFWVGVILFRFYRDPERVPPQGEGLIVSPADGRVIYIKEVREGKVPLSAKGGQEFELDELTQTDLIEKPSALIGIEMSILNVHVNRAAIKGRVVIQKRTDGDFISLKRPEAVLRNSRLTTVIENDRFRAAIIQIASRRVRLITSYVREGDELCLGQRLGMIKFGSQVDVVLPKVENLRILTGVGEQVRAGVSVLATCKQSTGGKGTDPSRSL